MPCAGRSHRGCMGRGRGLWPHRYLDASGFRTGRMSFCWSKALLFSDGAVTPGKQPSPPPPRSGPCPFLGHARHQDREAVGELPGTLWMLYYPPFQSPQASHAQVLVFLFLTFLYVACTHGMHVNRCECECVCVCLCVRAETLR